MELHFVKNKKHRSATLFFIIERFFKTKNNVDYNLRETTLKKIK